MITDIIKCAIKNISRKKGRNSLIIMGIAIGVASVVIISNISNCGTKAIEDELNSLGLSGITINAETVNCLGATQSLSDKDLNAINTVNNVKSATPVTVKSADIFTNNTLQNTLVWGINSTANKIVSLKVLYGRYINNNDIKSRAAVCLVDQNFSKLAYKRDNCIGKKVSISIDNIIEDYEVIGIVKTGSGLLQNIMGDYIPNFVYVPYTTMQNVLGNQTFDQIAVKVDEKANIETVGKQIIDLLDRNNGTINGYKANNLAKQKDGLLKLMNIVTIVLSAVGAISLLVASLSIMTIMLVSVSERKREIGIKKSIGAKNSTIMMEFLIESLVLTLIGSILGILIGMLNSVIGAVFAGISLSIRFDILSILLLFSVSSGVLFGVYPAKKAAQLNPVDALEFRN